MITKTDQQIQIINSNRSAKSTDRYLDTKGNVWVGAVDGRLIIPPFSTELPTSKTDGSLSVEQRLLNLEANVNLVKNISVKNVHVDFGLELYQKSRGFTFSDNSVTASSIVVAQIAYKKPDGKDLDEVEMDDIIVRSGAGDGQVYFFLTSSTGSVYGKYWVSYVVKK